jgi:hypothetical protein
MAVDRDGNRMEPPFRALDNRREQIKQAEGLNTAAAGQKAYRQLLAEKHAREAGK